MNLDFELKFQKNWILFNRFNRIEKYIQNTLIYWIKDYILLVENKIKNWIAFSIEYSLLNNRL